MHKQLKHVGLKISIAATVLLAASYVGAATVPNTLSPGTPATAADMNENFQALADAVTAVEGAGTGIDIAVDCNADPNALRITTIKDNTTYTLIGMCNGPIEVFQKRNVVFQGVDTNTKTDGIKLLTGITMDPDSALGVYESSIELRNLRLDASNYVSNSYPWGVTDVGALYVAWRSKARVSDVDLVGGDIGLGVFRSAYANIRSNVTVTGFNIIGISAFMNSHVAIFQTIQVVGSPITTTSFPETVTASTNSSIDIKNGGTFTPAGNGSGSENYAVSAYHNSSIKVRNGGAAALLNGTVGAANSGDIKIQGNAVVVGHIDAWDSGVIRFSNSSQSGGYVSAVRLARVRIDGSSSINTTGFSISAKLGSNIGIRNTATVTSDSPISLNTNSTLYTRDTVDLGNAGITCQSQLNQVDISGPGQNVGSLAGCP